MVQQSYFKQESRPSKSSPGPRLVGVRRSENITFPYPSDAGGKNLK